MPTRRMPSGSEHFFFNETKDEEGLVIGFYVGAKNVADTGYEFRGNVTDADIRMPRRDGLKEGTLLHIDAVARKCPPQGFLSNKKCVKATILESFASQGGAGAHCEAEDPLGPLLMCMELITASERAYRALGTDPQSVTGWDDPYDAFAAASASRLNRRRS